MRSFYNWFARFYPMVEKNIDPIIDEIVKLRIAPLPAVKNQTAIEYACGTGSLSLALAPRFRKVEGRDLSGRMLERAKKRAREAGLDIGFRRGDLLAVEEPAGSFDRVFVSFALHLFSPERIPDILRRLLDVCRESVTIIDHPRKRNVVTAFIEWIEGSYYDQFIHLDFRSLAKRIGADSFREWETDDATVMIFAKRPQA